MSGGLFARGQGKSVVRVCEEETQKERENQPKMPRAESSTTTTRFTAAASSMTQNIFFFMLSGAKDMTMAPPVAGKEQRGK